MITAYLRVSTDMQDVESQKIGVNEFCKQKGWEIDEFVLDEGVSGAKDPSKRKLGGIIKKAKAGDKIIFSEISRIGRKLDMILDFIRECSERGVAIYTVKDRYVLEDTIQSKVLVTVMGLAAEIERDLLRQRTKEGLKRARENGKILGRPKGSFGCYKLTDEQVENARAAVGLGISISKIAKKLRVHRMTLAKALSRASAV